MILLWGFQSLSVTLYKLCAFPMGICILSKDVYSRGGTSSFNGEEGAFWVRHISIPGEDMHYRWFTSPFQVIYISIPGDSHPHSRCGCVFLMRMNRKGINTLTGKGDVTHREWDLSHWECISSPGTQLVYTGSILWV